MVELGFTLYEVSAELSGLLLQVLSEDGIASR